MTPMTNGGNAVFVLLSLAKQHSGDVRNKYRVLQNMRVLSSKNSYWKRHDANFHTPAPFAAKCFFASWTPSSVTQTKQVPASSRNLASTSRRVVASLSLWQSKRGEQILRGSGQITTAFGVCSVGGCRLSRHFGTNAPSCQKEKFQSKNIPQVETPNHDGFIADMPAERRAFRGLETDFPCLTRVKQSGPEPEYDNVQKGYKVFSSENPFQLKLNQGVLPRLDMAYETWGQLNSDASNAVLIMAGLSASSHARSSVENMRPGWWERFVGPGCAVDTNKFFVICPNNLGGCYGSSGPSSINVVTGEPYGTTFPIINVEDMTNAIFMLLDHLGIEKLYGSVGSSLGGMLSLQSAVSFPKRVGRLVTISSCAQSHPSSIAMRYLQRKCIMCDPNWNKGHYYGKGYPKVGMKLAREIATITYRSGPEWDDRFGRGRISEDPPSLCPTFLIESYLEHQGESFSTKFDPNSLLYVSKAMDLFDIAEGRGSLQEGLSAIRCPVMVIGVQTDVLFPIWQQRELAKALISSGNEQVTFYEINSLYGHDTFLLDLNGVGAAVKGFLETEQSEMGIISKHQLRQKERKLF